MDGVAKASIGMKSVQWGWDTLKHPNGDVSCPALNPNLGSTLCTPEHAHPLFEALQAGLWLHAHVKTAKKT